ncbi:hypothetical protein [Atlantibacter hermannii]|uniref:hypothetical protein n=1 Tax=Atlantibacter hermannii TaxID=565 RepID=UPI0022B79FAC|nr:hypothetical protein [Atlantibacter hermannii]MCZ7834225.1 hypothetical protein [Atlantibacter hermannii]
MGLSLPGNRLICLARDNLAPESFERIIPPFAAWKHAEQDYQFNDRWDHQRYIINIEPKSTYPLAAALPEFGERSREKLKALIEHGDVVCLDDISNLPASLFYIDDNGALICRDENAFKFGGAKRIIEAFNIAVSKRDCRRTGGKPAPTGSRQLRGRSSQPETYDSVRKTLNSKSVGRLLAAGGIYNGNMEGFRKTAEQLGGEAPAGYEQVMDNKGSIIAGASVVAALTMGKMRFPELNELEHFGARGTYSGRSFDPELAGGPIENLTTDGVTINHDGIAIVEKHISRFLPDPANDIMIGRLKKIADGEIRPEQVDLNYYTHECREYERYCKLGWATGQPEGDAGFDLWNHAHTATLEDFKLKGTQDDLYHSDALNYDN